MNSLQNLIQRLTAIGQVNEEAEEKCSKCGCTPCECDDKEKVEEAKKPDDDNDGIPDWADKDEEKVDEGAMDTLKAMGKKALDTLGHGDDEDLIKDMQKKAGLPQTGKKPDQEEVKETALNFLRRYAGIQESNDEATVDEALNTSKLADTMGVDVQQLRMAVSRASNGKQTRSDIMLLSDTFVKLLNNPDDMVIQTVANLIKSGNTAPAPDNNMANMKQEGNEFSGALKAAKDAGAEEFEVGGKKYKVNECSDMSPMTSVPNGESHMGIPAEIMAHMSQHQEPEMAEPEGPHMEVPMTAEAPKYTLNITNGDNNLSMTTDMPDEIIHIMKLAGVNKGAEVTKKEMPADGEQEVEESGYENTPDNTKARDPQAHGDIRDWGQKGTGAGNPNYPGTGASGDNPMNEQRMFDDYKNFKAGK